VNLDGYDLKELVEEYQRRAERNRFLTMFADREKYPKHNLFFAMGGKLRQRLFLAGNRVGKTTAALCEVVMHLTGEYPIDWVGHRFTKPPEFWIVGRDGKTIKDTLQPMLLGKIGEFGSGLVPRDKLDFLSLSEATKTASAVESFRVMHSSGKWSYVQFRTAESGRAAFQGTERSILIDEECPVAVYEECLLRTMTGGNILMMTFTPLFGYTPLLKTYYEGPFRSGDINLGIGKFVVQVSMNECPHLLPSDIEEILSSCHPSQREARRMGIPELGAGSIFPVPEEDILVDDFEIPDYWPRIYGMDVGWKNTAACWIALNPDTGEKFIYGEYKRGEVEPAVHVAALKSKGSWIPGIIDSAANSSSQMDGKNLKEEYEKLGLELVNANKAVEAGLFRCYDGFSKGEIKVMRKCSKFMEEYREYKRDSNGKVHKTNDHIMDAFRYAIMKIELAITKPKPKQYISDAKVSPNARVGW
jgi:phage terminase large subunit-like protein